MGRQVRTPVALLAVAALALAAAQAGAGSGGGVRVVAAGLNNPRGVEIARDGSVFVAQAGAAGKVGCQKTPEGVKCGGFSGAIIRIANGEKQVYAAGFFSGGSRDGSFSVGIDDIAIAPGGPVYGIMASPGLHPETFGPEVAAQAGYVLRIDRGGKTAIGENVTAYEVKNNPARDNLDSDPYGIAWSPLGFGIADAAANSLLLLSPNGRLSTLATFTAEIVGGHAVQRVPTTVVWHDGAFYVGELGGGGAPNGSSKVWKVVPGQRKTQVAAGFTTITGLAFGPDGSMYVSELATAGLAAAERSGKLGGALIRVWPDGHRTELAPGRLTAPAGVAVGADGTAYVANLSVFARKGELLAISQ